MDNEQYSNMVDVEGFSNKDANAVDKKIKEKSLSGKKNSIAHIISILLILLGLAIIISYLGATLLFFTWSIGINNCSKNKNKNLFEYIFPSEFENGEFCKENNSTMSGGSYFSGAKSTLNKYRATIDKTIDNYFKDVKECLKNNESFDNFCNTSEAAIK